MSNVTTEYSCQEVIGGRGGKELMGRALNTIILHHGIKTLTTADGIKNTDTHIIEKEDQ